MTGDLVYQYERQERPERRSEQPRTVQNKEEERLNAEEPTPGTYVFCYKGLILHMSYNRGANYLVKTHRAFPDECSDGSQQWLLL